MMSLFAQLTINGLIAGSIYALVASGFSLIYSTNRFIHFAHGVSIAVSAYILYSLFSLANLNIIISIIFTLVLAAILGLAAYRLIYLPLQKRKASNIILLIASLAILILFQNMIQAIFNANVRTVKYFELGRGVSILGALITPLQITIIIISLALFVSLYILMQKTKIGREMRAVADNKELASISGINQQRVADYSFILGSLLAGVAGILIGLEQNLSPEMGTFLIVRGFTGAVVGGIFSVPASILGSYILGLAENYGVWFLPSGYKDAIAFVLLFIFLLFRPNGLFGKDRRVK